MKIPAAFTICLLAASLAVADPPGTIVIRPQGPTAPASPDRPGEIVIRPQAPGTRVLETAAVPPSTPSPNPLAPMPPKPVAEPVPVPDPKPLGTAEKKPEAPFDPAKGKIVSEAWDIAFVKGLRVGHFHVTVREFERDGKKYVYATKHQEITVARFGQNALTTAEDATLETPEGAVLVVRMSQEVSNVGRLAITGTVDGQTLRIQGEGMAAKAESVPWPEGVIGFARELSLYKDKKPKPGDAFDYNIYEGRLNSVIKINVKCLAKETVALLEGQAAKPYLKFEVQMQEVQKFQFPPATVWVDAETLEPMRTDQDMLSLGGKLTVIRSTKEVALRPLGKVPDIFDVQSIKLDPEIEKIHDRASVTYKINLSLDREPYTCFPKDAFNDRQTPVLAGADRKTVELKVLHGSRVAYAPPTSGKEIPTAEIYLSKSFFIDWDNDITKKQAYGIAMSLPPNATEADKAKAVEQWVFKNMRAVTFDQAMAPTSEVSKTLKGDCTEYAMLAVGLCRAMGLMSRTALGLVYAHDNAGKPILAYHMWFEVWESSKGWVPYDATLGRGGIGPGHLKITDAHWYKENSFAPLLPVLRVLQAQPKVEVGLVEDK